MSEKKHLFIVDDSPTVLKTTSKFLENTDFEVHCFNSAVAALDTMSNISPHIILLDYMMPDMNGDEFMIKVSERLLHFHDWKVFLISSKDFTAEEQFSMQTLGIAKVFKKPIAKDKLLTAISAEA